MSSIGEFIRLVQRLRDEKETVRPLDWNSVFEDQGYYSVTVSPKSKECWVWCDAQYGKEHYAWTGSKFFFETEQDAIMFTLRWS
jgi:hypothetical protein